MKKYIKHLILIIAVALTSAIFVGAPNATNHDYSQSVSIAQVQQVTATDSLPSSYDLRQHISIGVENQNPYGICFAFASLTSLETYLALNYGEYYDFSELHFALSLYLQDNYYTSVDDALKNGGNFSQFDLYTQKDKSIVLEDEMPMSKYASLNANKYSTMVSDYNNINNNFYTIAKVNGTTSFPQYAGDKSEYSSVELTNFRNNVKQHLMNYGSLTAGIYTSDSLFTYNTVNYRITDDSLLGDKSTDALNRKINHLISIVGWDDNYDAGGAWANKGAYICLNSWGEEFGEDGYFYVSYDDYFIEYTIQGITDATLATTNNRISTISLYQQNTSLVTHTYGNDIYIANIVDVSNHKGKQIQYIDNFVKGNNTSFYINFYDTYANAVSGIANIGNRDPKSSTKVSTHSIYERHKLSDPNKLSDPITISNNFIVIISKVVNASKIYSLATRSTSGVTFNPTFYSMSSQGQFKVNDSDYIWNPPIGEFEGSAIIPIVLHLNSDYVGVSKFSGNADSYIDTKYKQNNAIFYNKTINIELSNTSITDEVVNNIRISKLYNNSFADSTSSFNITFSSEKLAITMTSKTSSTFKSGNYLIKIPLINGQVIYRVIEVQNRISYSITYHTYDGVASNPAVYSDEQNTLHLNNPVKDGYTFVGWYLDESFTTEFNPNNLPYTNLALYAKYDFASPTLNDKSNNISVTYYDGISVTISVDVSHALVNEYNALTYQWYMRKNSTDDYTIVDGATTNSLTLNRVNQSGHYACEAIINISDTSLTDEPCTRVLSAGETTEIIVNIKPYIYDMSKAIWNYTQPISYDTSTHTVEVVNLPDGVTVEYTGNSGAEINTYTAHADLVYDDMDGNAIANPIQDLVWEIRRAKIVITIQDIISYEEISLDAISGMYSCTIDNEYMPANINTLQDKLDYLELVYELQDTSQKYIKTITASTITFDIHEIIINNGEYRVIVDELSNGDIKATNSNGFVKDCVLTVNKADIDNNIIKTLKEKHLSIVDSYNISYSYLDSEDVVTVSMPVAKQKLFNTLSLYMLKDGKVTKVNNVDISADGITFKSSELNATYIIVEADNSHTSNVQYLILLGIGGGFIVLYLYIIIHKKHKSY